MDGLRRKTDKTQFERIIKESTVESKELSILRVHFPEECRLLKEWHDSNALVFFDFQEAIETKQPMLWFLFPRISTGEAYISVLSRVKFIELHNKNKFDEFVSNVILPIQEILASNKQIKHENNVYSRPNRLSGFDRFIANKPRRQRRL